MRLFTFLRLAICGAFLSALLVRGQVQEKVTVKRLAAKERVDESLMCLDVSPDGNLVAVGGRTITIISMTDRSVKLTLGAPKIGIRVLAFSPDSSKLATGAEDGTITIWDIAKKGSLRTMSPLKTSVISLSFSTDGKNVIAGYMAKEALEGGTTLVWNINDYKQVFKLDGAKFGVSGSGKRIVTANVAWEDIWIADAETGKVIAKRVTKAPIWCIAHAPAGEAFCAGCNDGTIWFWSSYEDQTPVRCTGHALLVYDVAYSKDGSMLASASYDGSVRLWDTKSYKCIATFAVGDLKGLHGVRFSPDGRVVVVGSLTGRVEWWRVDARKKKSANGLQ